MDEMAVDPDLGRLIGRDGHLNQSGDYDQGQLLREFWPRFPHGFVKLLFSNVGQPISFVLSSIMPGPQ